MGSDLARYGWQRKRSRTPSKMRGFENRMDLNEAARQAETYARGEWGTVAITDKYEDADYYVIKGVSPSGEWTVMFDKRSGKRVIPP